MRAAETEAPPAGQADGGADDHALAASIGANCTTAPTDALLARLDRVREMGKCRWIACCPAHDDRNPSLSIAEGDDGRVLLRCWAGCTAADVVAAVGLDLRDLFPPNDHYQPKRKGQRWVPREVLAAVATEAIVCAVAAEDVAAGKVLADTDLDRLHQAVGRLNAAAREVRQ